MALHGKEHPGATGAKKNSYVVVQEETFARSRLKDQNARGHPGKLQTVVIMIDYNFPMTLAEHQNNCNISVNRHK